MTDESPQQEPSFKGKRRPHSPTSFRLTPETLAELAELAEWAGPGASRLSILEGLIGAEYRRVRAERVAAAMPVSRPKSRPRKGVAPNPKKTGEGA